MNRKARIDILNKIAQTALPQDTTTPNTVVSGSPPSFIASNFYPSMVVGLQTKNVPWVNSLANILNIALYYSSGGKINMSWLRQTNFNFATDQSPSADLRNILNFSKIVYNQLFTDHGANFQAAQSPEQIAERIRILSNSPFFNNLTQVSPTGQLASKIGGNLKTIINDYLLQIK
jgi:hypothetical protein